MHDHHRLARGAQVAQEVDDGALGHGVHALERLVHEVDARLLHQRARQEHPLLLAARQLADLAVAEVRHVHLGEGREGVFALGAARPAQPAELAVAPHHHDVQHGGGEVPVDAAALRHVPDQAPLLPVGTAVDQHLARGRLDQPHDRLHQGGLAGAVRADDRHQDAGRDAQVHVPQHRPVAVGHGQVGDLDGAGAVRAVRPAGRAGARGADLVVLAHRCSLSAGAAAGRVAAAASPAPAEPAGSAGAAGPPSPATIVSMLWRTMPS